MQSREACEETIWVVLATFNASNFVDSQIESICSQSHGDIRLLIRDDGSSDDTLDRVRRWMKRDARVELVEDEMGRLGIVGNFSRLLSIALQKGAHWVAISDHDDVWHPDKLSKEINCAKELDLCPTTACLVHSDLSIVRDDLSPISDSFLRFLGMRNEANPLPTLLVQNYVSGCTCLVNRRLLEIALPIPENALMHDWWLALCAASMGTIGFLPEATVTYRRHADSQVRTKSQWATAADALLRRLCFHKISYDTIVAVLNQAYDLRRRLLERQPLNGDTERHFQSLALTREFLSLFDSSVSGGARVRNLNRLGARKQAKFSDMLFKMKLRIYRPNGNLRSLTNPVIGTQNTLVHPIHRIHSDVSAQNTDAKLGKYRSALR